MHDLSGNAYEWVRLEGLEGFGGSLAPITPTATLRHPHAASGCSCMKVSLT